MAGNREGALKAKAKNIATDPDFYKKIGSQSWKNPARSHETGFAKLPREKHIALSRKGGKKTKDEYKNLDEGQKEVLALLQEALRDSTEMGE